MTIEEFIEARLADDEAVARTAAESFAAEGRKSEWHEQWSGSLNVGDELFTLGDATVTQHVERFDPARVLRQCAATRKLLEFYGEVHRSWVNDYLKAEFFLGILAETWSDHPDYRPEWTVDGGGSTS